MVRQLIPTSQTEEPWAWAPVDTPALSPAEGKTWVSPSRVAASLPGRL